MIGWDPGKSGGYSIYENGTAYTVSAKSHKTAKEMIEFFRKLWSRGHYDVYWESQTFCAGVEVSAFSMGRFGDSTGYTRGCLETIGFKLCPVRPQKWQHGLPIVKGVKAKKKKTMTMEQRRAVDKLNAPIKAQWKRDLKEYAIKLYPELDITLDTADAVLIMDYALKQKSPRPQAGQETETAG